MKAIRVKWTVGHIPYSNSEQDAYALVTPTQLAFMKGRPNTYKGLTVLNRNVLTGPETIWRGP